MCLVHVTNFEALATGPSKSKDSLSDLPMHFSIMAKISSPPPPAAESAPEDLDDYMSMTIVEPVKPAEKETYTQRRLRKQREVRPSPQISFPVRPLPPSASYAPGRRND